MKAARRRSSAGLVAFFGVVIVALGLGGFAYTQNWFGLLNPPVPEPEVEPEPTPEPIAAPEPEPQPDEPVVAEPEPETPVTEPEPEPEPVVAEPEPEPQGQTTIVAEPEPEPEPVVTEPEPEPEPVVADTEPEPVVVEPEPEPEPIVVEPEPEEEPETDVAIVEPEPEPEPALGPVQSRIQWVNEYPFSTCAYGAVASADEAGMDIFAVGNAVPPFETFDAEFIAAHGFSPNIILQLISGPQCVVADFLRDARPLTERGPLLSIDDTLLPAGAPLKGQLEGVSGWTTDLLLVSDDGIVHLVPVAPTPSGAAATFAMPLGTVAAPGTPMMVIAISSKSGLSTPSGAGGRPASTVFPAILRELQQEEDATAVSAGYAKMEGG